MFGSAPPPPRISTPPCHIGLCTRLAPLGLGVRPPPRFGKSCIRPWGKNRQAKKRKKRGLHHEKVERPKLGPHSICYFCYYRLIRHCNEVTLLICLGLIFFLKFAPTSWAGAPSKACAGGHDPPPPLPPPPSARHYVDLLSEATNVAGPYPEVDAGVGGGVTEVVTASSKLPRPSGGYSICKIYIYLWHPGELQTPHPLNTALC